MYLIAKDKTQITKLNEKKFSEVLIRERNHLQEWLAHNPEALGEELLIIQKEFSGFKDTNERLDLLAIDKSGNLVIIENKIDDSGKNVTWQALKYVSYCSSLNKEEIKNIFQEYLNKLSKGVFAEDKLSEFYGKDYDELNLNAVQRIMLVAGNFRKEVTSTVIWLLNYKIQIKCFETTLLECGEQLFLKIEQILPGPIMEEFTISIAKKTQDAINSQKSSENSDDFRFSFWQEFVNKSPLFKNISPLKESWIALRIGGVNIQPAISKSYAKVEIYINKGKEQNKKVFDLYKKYQEEIEREFGDNLIWDRMDDKSTSRIRYQLDGVNVFEKSDWPKILEFLVDTADKMNRVFQPYSLKLSEYLKKRK